ncbi:MAG: hypothetical protein HQ559_12720 [Lentisphaerae bacterium]|nr:hypothetical protein [Lentisphaerota bacterium]
MMTEKTRVLLVPAYYGSTDKGCVDRDLNDAKAVLDKTDVDYTETVALSDLDTGAAIRKQAQSAEYDVVLLYLISWVDMNVVVDLLSGLGNRPCIVWSVDWFACEEKRTHLGAFAALLPIKGSLEQMGIKFSYLYGNPGKEGLQAELAAMLDAAGAVAALARARIGMVGYAALGMYPGMVHPLGIKKLLGAEIIPIDNHTLISLCEANMEDDSLLSEKESFEETFNITEPLSEKDVHTCVAMTAAIRQLVERHGLAAITLKCCFELASDYGFAPCVPLSMLSDECVTSCESDIPVTLTQLVLRHLARKPSPYVDVMMMGESRMYCACCGFGAFAYARDGDKRIAYSCTGECESELSFGRVINTSRYEDGAYTLARLNVPLEGRPFMQVITGENRNDFEPFYELGCKEYPSMGLIVKQPTDRIMDALTSQHLALVEGDMTERLRHFCRFTGIEMKMLS